MTAPSGQTLEKAKSWVTRRVVGYIIFAIVSSVLGAIAVSQGFLTGGPTFQTVCGAFILAVAFLISFAFTTRMKERTSDRLEHEEWAESWRAYYARQAQQIQRAWQEYYARQRQRAQQARPAPPTPPPPPPSRVPADQPTQQRRPPQAPKPP